MMFTIPCDYTYTKNDEFVNQFQKDAVEAANPCLLSRIKYPHIYSFSVSANSLRHCPILVNWMEFLRRASV